MHCLKTSIKKPLTIILRNLALVTSAIFASVSWAAAASSGIATFTADGRTYSGTYSVADKRMSVDIDGAIYNGHYATNAEDSGAAGNTSPTGSWGRAFLFASSAKVLRCKLDAGFPKVSGQCEGADGRQFQLKHKAVHSAASAPKRFPAN